LITASRTEELDAIRARYEDQYEAHTERLARLIARRHPQRSSVVTTAEIAAYRRALADTARALQRMADRDFGHCQHCAEEIPIERLRVRPDLRYCHGCHPALSA
jgi:RNA polymerase-binding transcription factor DksA